MSSPDRTIPDEGIANLYLFSKHGSQGNQHSKRDEVTYKECCTFINQQQQQQGPIDLNQHRVNNEIKVCFNDSTVDNQENRFYINGKRDYHVDRYITDGCRIKLVKCKEGRKLMKDAKVQKIRISYRNPNKIQAKVIGTCRGSYTVAVKFGRNIISKNKTFKSTRDIVKTQCSGCGVNSQCRHVAAVLFSVCDYSSIQKPLKHSGLDCYQETEHTYKIADVEIS
eukprot:183298_1